MGSSDAYNGEALLIGNLQWGVEFDMPWQLHGARPVSADLPVADSSSALPPKLSNSVIRIIPRLEARKLGGVVRKTGSQQGLFRN